MEEVLKDEDRKWLIERQVDSYLAWIGLWLVCLLGNASVLTSIVINDASHSAKTGVILVVYIGLIVGMIFSVYRLAIVTGIINSLTSEIENPSLYNFIFNHRGRLSSFAVDNKGKLHKLHLVIVGVIHIAVFLVLLYFALL